MRRLLLLNGPPGIGKSTLARRWSEDNPGTLCADIDQLRTMIGGWRADFLDAGTRIRPAAVALIGAYLRHSGDVALPQFLADAVQVDAFAITAAEAGAEFVHVLVTDHVESCVRRFNRRDGADPWHREVRQIVAEQGGDEVIRTACSRLDNLASADTSIRRIASIEGDADATYRLLVAATTPPVPAD